MSAAVSNSEKIKLLAKRFATDIMTKGNLDVADEIFTRDYQEHDPFNPPDAGKGPQMVKEVAQMYRNAFPDSKMTNDEVIHSGDRLIVRWTAQGTHKGDLMGISATNRKVKVSGITIYRLRGEKLAEAWTNWDTYGLLTQLGLITAFNTPKPRKKVA